MIGEQSRSPHDLEDLDEDSSDVTSTPSWEDPLEALWDEVQAQKKPKTRRLTVRDAQRIANAELSQRLKAIYSNPENWSRTRGVALVDLETGTLIGNFSEYRHNSDPYARKLVREHQPIEVSGTELINGYLGADVEARIKNVKWDAEHLLTISLQLDELMVEAPTVELKIMTRFGGIIRADLVRETQFASASGNLLLRFAAGTNVWEACSTDSKIRIRKGLPA